MNWCIYLNPLPTVCTGIKCILNAGWKSYPAFVICQNIRNILQLMNSTKWVSLETELFFFFSQIVWKFKPNSIYEYFAWISISEMLFPHWNLINFPTWYISTVEYENLFTMFSKQEFAYRWYPNWYYHSEFVNLGVIPMKGYSTFPRTEASMQFSFWPRTHF